MKSRPIVRRLARLGMPVALLLHLCGAAVGPLAHAESVAGRAVEEFHPEQSHVEAGKQGHQACALCHAVGQPTLASLSPGFQPFLVSLHSLASRIQPPAAPGDLATRARGPPAVWLDRTVRA